MIHQDDWHQKLWNSQWAKLLDTLSEETMQVADCQWMLKVWNARHLHRNFLDEQHSCHYMLDEILGEIDDVVNDMCEATPEAEVNVNVPVTRCSLGLWRTRVYWIWSQVLLIPLSPYSTYSLWRPKAPKPRPNFLVDFSSEAKQAWPRQRLEQCYTGWFIRIPQLG